MIKHNFSPRSAGAIRNSVLVFDLDVFCQEHDPNWFNEFFFCPLIRWCSYAGSILFVTQRPRSWATEQIPERWLVEISTREFPIGCFLASNNKMLLASHDFQKYRWNQLPEFSNAEPGSCMTPDASNVDIVAFLTDHFGSFEFPNVFELTDHSDFGKLFRDKAQPQTPVFQDYFDRPRDVSVHNFV